MSKEFLFQNEASKCNVSFQYNEFYNLNYCASMILVQIHNLQFNNFAESRTTICSVLLKLDMKAVNIYKNLRVMSCL